MRPNDTSAFKNTYVGETTKIHMGFDASAVVHLMDMLTQLYSDAEVATIREYASNAHDSHLAAGNKNPIEVFLPTHLNSTYRVVDHGVGMSVDDIINIYSKYGASTKRNNDIEAGMMGLGCKAGLAYVNQFTLTAVKNGVKTLATVSRGDDGAGDIDILDTISTNEPNGVTVEFDVKDPVSFNRKAKDFFKYWKPGTVLVDGNEPSVIEGQWVTDDIVIVESNVTSYDRVVMGNISYPVKDRMLSDRLNYSKRVIAWVPMRSVEFTPSREALKYVDKTTKTLNAVRAEMFVKLEAAARKEINAASGFTEAVKSYLSWKPIVPNLSGVVYRGHGIPSAIDCEGFSYDRTRYHRRVRPFAAVSIGTLIEAVQVVNFINKDVSSAVKRKLHAYCKEHGIESEHFLFVEKKVGGVWADDVLTIDYDDIKRFKLVGNHNGKRLSKEEFVTYIDGKYEIVSNHDFSKERVVLTSPAFDARDYDISKMLDGARIVILAKNRWAKFIRENKGVESVMDAVEKAIKENHDKWTASEYIYYAGSHLRFLEALNEIKFTINDPQVAKAVGAVANAGTTFDKAIIQEHNALENIRRRINNYLDSHLLVAKPDLPEPDGIKEANEIYKEYPLLRSLDSGRVSPSDVVDYINAMYERNKHESTL